MTAAESIRPEGQNWRKMPRVTSILRQVNMEVPLFLYMFASYLKYPVFQNLIYEKVCLEKYNDELFCANVSGYHNNHEIHERANHVYFLSSITLLAPSVVVTLALGLACDIWSTKLTLLIPFAGLVISTCSYIAQSVYIRWNVYLLLISDLVFGVCGGYLSVIGTTMAYSIKTTPHEFRSIRIALMEGSIGLGGVFGYELSGTLRSLIGYSWCFVVQMGLQVLAFTYILAKAEELIHNEMTSELIEHERPRRRNKLLRVVSQFPEIFRGFYSLLTRPREYRAIFLVTFCGLGLELLTFAGLSDVQYSFLRYKLGWGDKEYGWLTGFSFATTTLTVFTAYPFLRLRGLTNGMLAVIGLALKTISLCILAFVSSTWMAYTAGALTACNRFISTGYRSFLSELVPPDEQGRLFSLTSFLEGITALLATSIYNNLYSKTLPIFPGLLILASAMLLQPSLISMIISDRIVHARNGGRLHADAHL